MLQASAHPQHPLPDATAVQPLLQAEDRLPEQPEGIVEIVHGRLHPMPHLTTGHQGHYALQFQPGGEDPLDDTALEFGGQAVPVLDDRELAEAFLQPGGRLLSPADPVPEAVRGYREQTAERCP